jgi:tripartite-type tricarboxylate transporter receptor subunit TctC
MLPRLGTGLKVRPARGACIAMLVAIEPRLAHARGYPARPITPVGPVTPGTGIDIIARGLGPESGHLARLN